MENDLLPTVGPERLRPRKSLRSESLSLCGSGVLVDQDSGGAVLIESDFLTAGLVVVVLREEGTRTRKQENKSKKSDSNDSHDLSRLFKIQGYDLCLLVNRLLRQVLVLARVPPDEHDPVMRARVSIRHPGASVLRERERVTVEFVIVFADGRKIGNEIRPLDVFVAEDKFFAVDLVGSACRHGLPGAGLAVPDFSLAEEDAEQPAANLFAILESRDVMGIVLALNKRGRYVTGVTPKAKRVAGRKCKRDQQESDSEASRAKRHSETEQAIEKRVATVNNDEQRAS